MCTLCPAPASARSRSRISSCSHHSASQATALQKARLAGEACCWALHRNLSQEEDSGTEVFAAQAELMVLASRGARTDCVYLHKSSTHSGHCISGTLDPGKDGVHDSRNDSPATASRSKSAAHCICLAYKKHSSTKSLLHDTVLLCTESVSRGITHPAGKGHLILFGHRQRLWRCTP